ncbi:hypothetical protein ACFYY5_29040 [Nocardia elegans]|uniref:Uncharacterized protein n=1 Tax=Nocardia elegans TaxID=300029 RepID=A0ABW6TM59_9NOCA
MIEPSVDVIRYEVSCLPWDHPERDSFAITVEYRGRGKWAVSRFTRCYDIDGSPDWEPIPSERTDEWLARYRHDLDDALRIAREVAPGLKNWRRTVADALADGDSE